MFYKILLPIIALSVLLSSSTTQQKSPHFVQFNNFSATFEVPVGKSWVINQVFSSFTSDVTLTAGLDSEIVPIRIFIKTLNGDIKTDFEGNRFGPQLYQSNNTAATIPYPIVLPEKTTFSLVMLKGDPGKCSMFDGTGYMSYYEVTNDTQP